MDGNVVIVFGRFPEPGQVKTRLSPPLSAAGAADVHRACLEYVLGTVRRAEAWRSVLAITPDTAVAQAPTTWGEGAIVWAQEKADLGARMGRAAERAFQEGAGRVVIVGTDSPTCAPRRIAEAFALLDHDDAVMGPCRDGGYYLVGMRRCLPALFDDVEWGSDRVAEHTRRNAAWLGLDLVELPMGYDIDRPEDVDRAVHELADAAPGTAEWTLREALTSAFPESVAIASLAATRRGARSPGLDSARFP